ncbi:serine protease inhibitor [Culex quinquefasciatus]|uniref:Serine protease inhibitor n=1 Tax=Culex quinquefasciatus TaxID=7176 RepID=B0W9A2_CULQU|nr:serine protease inhibitor [Culex quinquefasciatus]|eukprot:XP_001845286.1 serine protease inhibitor [Culex quinquefasciatus]
MDLYSSSNQFTFEFFKTAYSPQQNVVVSPLAMFLILSMVYHVANEKASAELQQLLHLPEDKQEEIFEHGRFAFGLTGSLRVAQFVQSAVIDVDETGTFAAAFTIFGAVPFSAGGGADNIMIVRVNRPFMYLIRNVISKEIVFIGHYSMLGEATPRLDLQLPTSFRSGCRAAKKRIVVVPPSGGTVKPRQIHFRERGGGDINSGGVNRKERRICPLPGNRRPQFPREHPFAGDKNKPGTRRTDSPRRKDNETDDGKFSSPFSFYSVACR